MRDKQEPSLEIVETVIQDGAETIVLRVGDPAEPDLGDQYEILEIVGSGGMGTVYKVNDRLLGKTLAIKVLKSSLSLDSAAVTRFALEAESAANLTHSNIVAVYNHGQAPGGAPYLVMDFLEGDSLSNILKQEQQLSAVRATEIFIQIAEAIRHAHEKGVIHRDIKPSNIVIQNENGSDSIKLLDFGIARVLPANPKEANPATQTGEVFGTPLYMSPEQCMGEQVDGRSDIYSFGCLMYETLTGRNPFAAENPVKIIVKQLDERPEPFEIEFKHLGIPPELELIVMRCLEKSPSSRYQNVNDLLVNLKGLLSEPVYATVWQRVAAGVIDCIAGLMAFGILFLAALPRFDVVRLTGMSVMVAETVNAVFWLMVVPILVLSVLESFKSLGTPGQTIMKIRSRSVEGAMISFGRCCARLAAQGLTLGFCGFLFVFLQILLGGDCWDSKVGPLWVIATTVAGVFLVNASTLFTKWDYGPQLLFDRAFGRIVVQRPAPLCLATGARLKSARRFYPKQLIVCFLLSLILVVLPYIFSACYRIVHPLTAQEQKQADEKLKHDKEYVPVVYSKRDILEGEWISQDSLVERQVLRSKAPVDAYASVNMVVGMRAKYNIRANDVVSEHAVNP